MNSYHKLTWQGQNVKLLMKDTSICSSLSQLGTYIGVVNKNGTIMIKNLKDNSKVNLKVPFKRDPSSIKNIFVSEDGKYAVLITKENIILWDSFLFKENQFRIVHEIDKETSNTPSYDVVFYENSTLGKGCKIVLSYCALMNATIKKQSFLQKQVSSTKFFKNQIYETVHQNGVDEYFLKSNFPKPDSQTRIIKEQIEKDIQSKNPYLFNVTIDIQLSIKEPNYTIRTDHSHIKVPKTRDSPSECLTKWDKDGTLLAVVVNSPEPELYFYVPFQSISLCINIFQKEDINKELNISPIKDLCWTSDGLFLILINTKGMISILPRLGETAYINKEKQIGNISKESERPIYQISCHPSSQSFLITNGRKFSFYELPDVDIINLIYSYTKGENNSLFNLKKTYEMTMTLFRILISIPRLENYMNYQQSLNDLFLMISDYFEDAKMNQVVKIFEELFEAISWGKGNRNILIPHYINLFEKIFEKLIEKPFIDLTIQLLIYSERSIEKLIQESDKDVLFHKTVERPSSYLHELWIKIANKLEENLEKKESYDNSIPRKLSDDLLLQGVIMKLKQAQSTKNISFFELTKSHNLDEKKNNTLRNALEKYLQGDFRKASQKFFKIEKKKYINAGFICLLLTNDLPLCFKYLESKIGFNFKTVKISNDPLYQDIIALMARLIEFVYDSKDIVLLSPIFCFDQICDLIYIQGEEPNIKGYFIKLELIQKQFEQINYKGNILNLAILLWQSIGNFDQIIRICLKYSFYYKFFQNDYIQEKSIKIFLELIESSNDYLFIDKIFNLTENFNFNLKKQILKTYLEWIKKRLVSLDYRKSDGLSRAKKSLLSCLNYVKNEKDLLIKYQENYKDEKIQEFKYLSRYLWNIDLIERYKMIKFSIFDQDSIINSANLAGQLLSFYDLHSLEISLGIFFGLLFLLKRSQVEKLLSRYLTKESFVIDSVKGQFSRLKEDVKIQYNGFNQEWLYEKDENFWKFLKENFNITEELNLNSLIKRVNDFRIESFVPTLSREDMERILLKDFNYQTYNLPEGHIEETSTVNVPNVVSTPRRRKSAFSKMLNLIKGQHSRTNSKGEEIESTPRKEVPGKHQRKSLFSSFFVKTEEKTTPRNDSITPRIEDKLTTPRIEITTPRKKSITEEEIKRKKSVTEDEVKRKKSMTEEKKKEEEKLKKEEEEKRRKEEERRREEKKEEEKKKKEEDDMQFLEI